MTAFWDTEPCSFVETDRRFRGIALMMEAVHTSETSINFYETTRRNIPEGYHFHSRFRENLKSQCQFLFPQHIYSVSPLN
jgi:hypothetical protein